MHLILRSLLRRKLRTVLTISGIVIGVFALTVMGAMSQKLTKLVKGGEDYYKGKVIVVDGTSASAFFGGAPMNIDKAKEIAAVEGVKYVSPDVSLLLDSETGVSFGPPPMIVSHDPGASQYEAFKIKPAQGRLIEPNDQGKVVLGPDLAETKGYTLGQTIKLRNKDFEVVGIIEKTLTAPDSTAMMSLSDAQLLTHATLPEAFQAGIAPEKIVSDFAVYLNDPSQGKDIAARIQERVEAVKAYDSSFFEEQVSQGVAIFNLIILSGALIAIIVGGFSIANTMTFSVIDRTREIGIKKAVGARASRILREFLLEAAAIGVIGGLVGIGLGIFLANMINISSRDKGLALFLVTPALVISVFLFSVVISVVAGFFPARRASRLNPVEALRYE